MLIDLHLILLNVHAIQDGLIKDLKILFVLNVIINVKNVQEVVILVTLVKELIEKMMPQHVNKLIKLIKSF